MKRKWPSNPAETFCKDMASDGLLEPGDGAIRRYNHREDNDFKHHQGELIPHIKLKDWASRGMVAQEPGFQ